MSGHTDETVKHIADGLSVVTVVGTLAGILPAVAAPVHYRLDGDQDLRDGNRPEVAQEVNGAGGTKEAGG
jgi:hypothetical protein